MWSWRILLCGSSVVDSGCRTSTLMYVDVSWLGAPPEHVVPLRLVSVADHYVDSS
jgi:hypothetical protein